MNLRKTAGLLMAFGLVVGLIGTGVSATFVDQVTATENISVGTFGCQIIGGNGTIGNSPHTGSTITYNAPKIINSAAGNAPFTFTVKNVGTIPQKLTITASAAGGSLNSSKFTAMTLAPASPVPLGASDTQVFDTGIQWTELNSNDLGDSGSITWTVDCEEVPATQTIVRTQIGIADTGWYGWSCPAGSTIVSGSVDTASVIDGPAKPATSVDGFSYPTYPHYTYNSGANEQGWVVHNAGGPSTQVLTIVCQP